MNTSYNAFAFRGGDGVGVVVAISRRPCRADGIWRLTRSNDVAMVWAIGASPLSALGGSRRLPVTQFTPERAFSGSTCPGAPGPPTALTPYRKPGDVHHQAVFVRAAPTSDEFDGDPPAATSLHPDASTST